MRKIISVFGSSRPAEGDPEYVEAREIGKALALEGFVVCNGGYGGIMEASSAEQRKLEARPLASLWKPLHAPRTDGSTGKSKKRLSPNE